MRNKRVLLLSEGFGVGHTQAAHALSASLRLLSSRIQPRVLELGTYLHPTLAPLLFNAYRRTVVAQPRLYRLMYRSQYRRTMNRVAQLALHRLFYAQTMEIIRSAKPDAIVCTHPFPSAVVSRLKRFGLEVPLLTVITDYDAHGTWVSPDVNRYLVSVPDVEQSLLQLGVPADKVEVTGIPVHPNFWSSASESKEEIRARFALKDMPTVLVMGGGWGLMGGRSLLRQTAAWADRIQLVYCFGNNRKALIQAAHDPCLQHENIQLIGFTDEIDKYMDVSDILITKPGGMTCTEGLAKGIPMLFSDPVPGQEEENCHYFTAQGFGERITPGSTIERWFELLTRHHPELQRRRSLLAGQRAYNPKQCVEAIMHYL